MNSSEARKRFTEWMNDPAAADAITKEGSIDASWIGFWKGWKASLAAAPTPPAQDGMVEVIREDADNYCRILSLLGMEEEGDPVAEIERLLSAPPAQEDEPVAYVVSVRKSIGQATIELNDSCNLKSNDALYTRPDNSGLRKAAEQLHSFLGGLKPNMHNWLTENNYMHLMKNLRDALEGK